MKCSYKNKFSHVDNAKGNGVKSEPHRTLQMFLGTYSIDFNFLKAVKPTWTSLSQMGMGGGCNNFASGLEVGDNFAVTTKAEN
jgi:hypothetical protein